MTPPTPEQITALEQWARERCDITVIGPEQCDATLALCETVRAQGAALRDGVRENWAMQQERDAAVARAEQAERERDEARTDLDGWVKCASSSRCIYCGQEFVHDPQDRINAALADLAKLRAAVEALHDYETTGAPDYHEWDRYFDAVYAAAREGTIPPLDLLTVLRHAEREQRRLAEGGEK